MKNDSLKTVILLALVVILIGGGLTYWQFGARSEAEARLSDLRSKLPDADQVNADLAKSQQDLQAARMELDHLEKSLPETAYIPTLLKELESLGSSKNVKIAGIRPIVQASVDPKAKKGEEAYESVEIDITGQGTYRALLEFISALKGFPKILAVSTISMQPRQDAKATGTGLLDATIRLRAYVFKQQLDENGLPVDPAQVSDTPAQPGAADGTAGSAQPTNPNGTTSNGTGTQAPSTGNGSSTHAAPAPGAKSSDLHTHTPSKEGAL